jgi:hypothetical protein
MLNRWAIGDNWRHSGATGALGDPDQYALNANTAGIVIFARRQTKKKEVKKRPEVGMKTLLIATG